MDRDRAEAGAPDGEYLERARILARSGWGRVHPNPMVGCVLVREGRVVGEGYHEVFGGPHAEVIALRAAGRDAAGATAYVTLEPCNHHGKTPPCAQALVEAGVVRVVFGAADPGEDSAGGAQTLAQAGVEVVGPVWDRTMAHAENPAFFHLARHRTPFVAVKMAQTLDGCVAAGPGLRTRITGPDADRRTHELRAGFDALLVGAGTSRVDDPLLTVRLAPQGRLAPVRAVVDPMARIPTSAAVFRDAAEIPVHVFTRRDAPEADLERLEGAGAHVHPTASSGAELELASVLGTLWGLGVRSVLCEGGPTLASALLRHGLAHRLYLWVAPFTLGARGVQAFQGVDPSVWGRFRPTLTPEVHGRDALLVYDREED